MSTVVSAPPEKKKGGLKLTDGVLGGLVAALSVLAALSAYLANQQGALSTDLYFESQSISVEANSLYLEANQLVLYDYQLYDTWFVETDAAKADYYYSQMSPGATASIERTGGAFDEQYYAEVYQGANEAYDAGLGKAQEAKNEGAVGDDYQLAVLILAVGLSFTGWASLIDSRVLKWIFIVLAGVILLVSLGQIVITWMYS